VRSHLLALALLVCATPLHAQDAATPPAVEFLPRAVFYMSAELLADEDPRLVWDTNFGGELDVIDYRAGRLTFAANYQAMLGEELRAFDPNQGNYILEGAASARLRQLEIAGVFYHQSRHLADRPKVDPIDWNMIGGRARGTFLAGAMYFDARADLRASIQRSFVDYEWEFDGRVRGDQLLRPGVGVMVAAWVRHLGVDGSRNRSGQTGLRGEAGLRFEGGAGAAELFVAAERRIDPYPLEFGSAVWVSAGFRLLSR
jgi:hypothetical protein